MVCRRNCRQRVYVRGVHPEFNNLLGHYTYQTIQPDLFFGYEMKQMLDGRTYAMATPEKAILDLLYLYPEYQTVNDMLELRLDEDFLHDDLDTARLSEYAQRMNSKALSARLQTLQKAFSL